MKTRLTKSEFAVMEVLWDEGEELTSAEIIQKSKEREWKDSSIHLIINSLLRKKVVTVAGFKKTTKKGGEAEERTRGGGLKRPGKGKTGLEKPRPNK